MTKTGYINSENSGINPIMLKSDVETISKKEGRLAGTASHDLARDHIVSRSSRLM